MRRSPLLLLVPLLVVVGAGCGSSDGEADEPTTTTSTTEVPPTTGTTQPLPLAARKAQLQLAPVRSNGPCDEAGLVPEGGGDPAVETPGTDTTVPAPGSDRTPDREGFLCYELGPVGGDGADLTAATAALDPQTGGWKVDVQTFPASVEALNGLFDACFAGQPTCPAGEGGHGAVAIVYQGAVVSAPSVQAASLASDTFTISGAFAEEEATELAEVLNA